jgi:acyl dehydratase
VPDDDLITEEMRSWLGKELDRQTLDVEKGAIRHFAEAIGDANRLWSDETAARRSRYGGITAPPTFLRSATPGLDFPFPTKPQRLLDGSSDWEYFEPIRAGDVITCVTLLADIRERTGRLGPMLFLVRETTYTNQLGQIAATQRSTQIRY